MHEADWVAAADPDVMLNYLRGRASDRKLRLFAAACCRDLWPLLDARGRAAVEAAERYADGKATLRDITAARTAALAAAGGVAGQAAWAAYWAASRQAGKIVWNVCAAAAGAAAVAAAQDAHAAGMDRGNAWENARTSVANYQAFLLRECFGNPFRPLAVMPEWLAWNGGIVPLLARAVYDEWAFDRLPVLADALEEAGCTDADLLAHCRPRGRVPPAAGRDGDRGEHVRGCWVVDAILQKS
jgi:hypothetical protein